jgi:hypothetical protein
MSGPYGAETPDRYHNVKEQKKMGWFSRWFDRKVKEAWERARNEPQAPSSYPMTMVAARDPRIDADGLSMNIYGADGGTVLEFRHYNSKTDRHENSLHVISQSENFEERVAQAITMELLRKGIAK